jgi:3D (Asp-Asp-Asp) domain-containing protein
MKLLCLAPLFLSLLLLSELPVNAATINVAGVASATGSGYYLNYDGSFCTNGKVLFGAFSISQSALQSLIAGFQTNAPTYADYITLLSDFTQVGTGGANGTTPSGWNFSTNGTIFGTSTNVDLSVFPAGTQMYAWSFNITNVGVGITNNASSFTTGTEWGLYTAGSNSATGWGLPSSGAKSLNLAQVSTSGAGTYLIGSAASSNPIVGNYSVKMVVQTVPEPTTTGYVAMAFIASIIVLSLRKSARSSVLKRDEKNSTT